MPAKKQSNSDGVEADGASNGFCFSETESKIIHAVLQRTDPSMNSIIDWEKVREDLASASVESTRKRFRQISLKRGWFKDEHNGGMSTPNGKNAATRTPGSKNKKVPAGDNDDGAVNDTPVKKRKTATPKKVKAEPDTTEENGHEGQDGANIDANGMGMNLSFDEV
ncbi:hypothetical protein PFICI_12286 [Pestalotiopsis fici W106-1]|uniref:Myb-like domain-containing protein n=1 Tax=Pestalotiopsis fici (strain W106-1 / CGMCC3.15140) TaxID=1229662 RepID=W3WQD0_PESFW|nr:uncharacterized protein PFICI_12286 [Pestalotiopsis fici W106-1]ETS75342.1 hypothetical protein PFICI_12286 [Pestalotiopsis fici W106-1]